MTSRISYFANAFVASLIVLISLAVVFSLTAGTTQGVAKTWDGGGSGDAWETANNWNPDGVPADGDDVTIDGTNTVITISGADTVNSLILGDSDGLAATTPTLRFNYAALAGTGLTVTNDLTMYNGADIDHTDNTTTQAYDIDIIVGGDMIINSGATIQLNTLGYQGAQSQSTNGSGPGAGTHATYNGGGAGHGGDGGDGASNSADGGAVNGDTFVPVTIGSSGASGTDVGTLGGDGGGGVRLTITGDLQLDGDITANAGPGIVSGNGQNGGGGGAGGTVNIVTGTLSCTDVGSNGCDNTPTITANGGDGADGTARDGGGGSGGRILVRYATTTMQTPADFEAIFSAIGGDGDPDDDGSGSSSQRTVEDGMSGTVLIIDEAVDTTNFLDADVWIISGFYFLDADKNDTSNARWRFNDVYIAGLGSSGVNLADLHFPTSASILDADGTMTIKDSAIDCTGVSTLELEADTLAIGGGTAGSTNVQTISSNCTDLLFDVNTGITSPWDGLTITMPVIDWDLPASTTLTLTDSSITTTGTGTTDFTIDDAITLNLGSGADANATTITANMTLDITNLNVESGSTISANGLGCKFNSNDDGDGPDGAGACTIRTTGYGDMGSYAGGGAGHGGAGGVSVDSAVAGATYDTAATPSTYRIGSSGARGESANGGDGGGYVKIDASGTMTISGTISADGTDGAGGSNNGAGAGSGGSIWLITGTLAGDSGGVLSADGGAGGDGGDRGGGGGGGGLVYVNYDQDTSSFYSSLTSANTTTGGAGGTDTGPSSDDGTAGDNGVLTALDNVPTYVSSVYQDNDNDGTVDQVVLTFSETVTIGGTVVNTRFTWVSSSGANGFAGSLSGNASASGTDVTVTISSAEANETGHSTIPTIAYDDNSNDATDKIQDAGGGIVQTFSAQNVTDGAAPAFVSAAATSDTNVQITMSESVNSVTFGGATDWVATGVTPSGVAINGTDTILDLTVSSLGDTSFTASDLAFGAGDVGGDIQDATSNATADFSSKSITDGQAPAFASAKYTDSGGDGTVDTVSITLSEAVATNAATIGDFAYVANDITSSAMAGGTNNAETASTFTLTLGTPGDSGITSHSTAPTIAYTFSSGALTDSAGNQTADFTAQNLTDGAGPVLTDSDPADSDTGSSKADDIVLTFSEAIDTGSFTYTCCGDAADPGSRSVAWSVGDTVASISHAQFQSNEDVTIDVTAAPDTGANAFGGAASGAADPFTFTTAASSGQVNVNSTPTTTNQSITVVSPNGGEKYMPGDSVSIGWTQVGRIGLVNVLYSLDQGNTWQDIAKGVLNLGFVDWVVPDVASTLAMIRVQGTDLATTFATDNSDSAFQIGEVSGDSTDATPDEETQEPTVDVHGDFVDPSKIEGKLELGEPVVKVKRYDDQDINLAVGDVFRGETDPAVYVLRSDGTRSVFPDSEVYFSYFNGFDNVISIKDNQLRKLQLGERMKMRPGTWLVKIQSDPKTYAVEEGSVLRHVPDEETAEFLYGPTWNQQIKDVNVAFFKDYQIGDALPSNLLPSGTVFTYEDSPQLYLLQNKIRRLFLDTEAFALNHFQDKFVRDISVVFEFEDGEPVTGLEEDLVGF